MMTKSDIWKAIDNQGLTQTENNHTCKPIHNPICAYRKCNLESSVRLEFPIGFSALFCKNCANILMTDGLAILSVEKNKET